MLYRVVEISAFGIVDITTILEDREPVELLYQHESSIGGFRRTTCCGLAFTKPFFCPASRYVL